jgi:hypothetical protein
MGIFVAILGGISVAFFPVHTVLGFGVIVYLLIVWLLTSERVMKRLLPYFMLIILFQETIALQLGELQDYFTYADEIFIILYLPAIVINFFQGKQIKVRWILPVIFSLIVIGTLSSLRREVDVFIAFQGMLLMMKGLVYLFIFANMNFNAHDLNRYKKWFKRVAIFVIFGAVVDLLFTMPFRSIIGNNNFIEYRIPGIVSLNSFFIHPGILGWFMVMLGLYYVAKIKMGYGYRNLIPVIVLFGVAALTFRFKVVLSIAVILGSLYLLTNIKKSVFYLIPIGILLACSYPLIGDYVINLTNLTIDRYLSVSVYDSARKALYYFSFEAAMDNFPYGVGFGQYGGFIARENYSPVYYEYGMSHIYGLTPDDPKWATDTYWPNILGEIGFVGFVILAITIILVTFKLLRGYKYTQDKSEKVIIFFGGLVMVQALVESFGEAIFSNTPQSFFVFMLSGMALSVLYNRNNIGKEIKEEQQVGLSKKNLA